MESVSDGGDFIEAPEVIVGQVDELTVGDVVDIAYPGDNDAAFIARLEGEADGGVGDGGDIVAFCRPCPHMGCPISEVDTETGIAGPCACHRSCFDLRAGGRQTIGRASQDLVQIKLEVRGKDLVASGVHGLPFGHAMRSR